MKIPFWRSLRMKLLMLLSVGLLLTIGSISYLNLKMFSDYLNRNLEDQTVSQTQDVGRSFEAKFDSWMSRIYLIVQSLGEGSSGARNLQNILGVDDETQAVFVFARSKKLLFSGFSSRPSGQTFRSKFKMTHSQVASLIPQGVERYFACPETEMVDCYLTVPVQVVGGAIQYVVLFVSNKAIRSIIPQSPMVQGYLLYDYNRIGFRHLPDHRDGFGQSLGRVQDLFKQSADFGFRAVEDKDRSLMIAYYRPNLIPNLHVVTVKDAEQGRLLIQQILIRTLTLVWVIFLVIFTVSYLSFQVLTRKLFEVTHATMRIAGGDFTTSIPVGAKDEVGLLTMAVNHMAKQIRSLLANKVEEARKEKELETARMVQKTFFPRGVQSSAFLEVSGKTINASECGGDWWSHLILKDGREWLIVADVTGHGASAALITAMAFTGCQMLKEIIESQPQSSELSPDDLLRRVNRVFYNTGLGTTTMTCVVIVLDPMQNRVLYANAGHNPPFVFKGDGGVAQLKGSGSPIGLLNEWDGIAEPLDLTPGDQIVLYSDGLIEGKNKRGKMWGLKSLKKNLQAHLEVAPERLRDLVLKNAFDYYQGVPSDDDITIVVARTKMSLGQKKAA